MLNMNTKAQQKLIDDTRKEIEKNTARRLKRWQAEGKI